MSAPTFTDIVTARSRISDMVHRTPLVRSFALSRFLDADIRLKLECFQDTRAFKVRGAANAILSQQERGPLESLVTYSTGNHGRATAYIATRLGIPATVCMSHATTEDKQAALAEMGADIRLVGSSQDEAHDLALQLAEEGMTFVDPINDPASTAGHGTIGLEIMEDFETVDTVVVPISGGALISGIAIAIKASMPSVRIVGVSMENGAAMYQSLEAGRPILVEEVESLADCLQGGITLDNTHTFATVRDMVDDFALVSEDEIARAMAEAFYEERLILEGAGATPIAAVMHRERSMFGDNIALVASGGNAGAQSVYEVAAVHRQAMETLMGSVTR
jgi:threonine dehydratase